MLEIHGPPVSPETLDFGVLDKSCSVRECHLGQWKQWDFLILWKHVIGQESQEAREN